MKRSCIAALCLAGTLSAPLFALTPAEEHWNGLPPEERQELLDNYRDRSSLPGEKKTALEENRRRWNSLSEEERARIRDRWHRHHQLSSEERQAARDRYERWKRMTPEHREKVRQRLKQRSLAPEEDERSPRMAPRGSRPAEHPSGRQNKVHGGRK
jgi:predicted Fe-S protein YdhL (DUF1289 family)